MLVSNRAFLAGSILLLTLSFIGGMSVVGILQTSERIGSSGIITKPAPPSNPTPPPSSPTPPPSSPTPPPSSPTPPPSSPTPPPSSPTPPPPEPVIEINVYSDSACTQSLSSVTWGSINVGDSVNKVIYIKNSGDSEVTLSLVTDSWSPSTASQYMSLTWNYNGNSIAPNSVVQIVLTLSVSSTISGINNFSFNITILGSAT
jgi:hypothetical protein